MTSLFFFGFGASNIRCHQKKCLCIQIYFNIRSVCINLNEVNTITNFITNFITILTNIMMATREIVLKIVLLMLLIFFAKKYQFVSSDGISITLKGLDFYDENQETFTHQSLWHQSRKSCFHRASSKNLFHLLLLVCGDIETCPGPGYVINGLRDLCREKGLGFVHQNIRGLKSNFESLCAFIDCHHNIDIITLSETHTLPDENPNLYNISGYDLILQSRKDGLGGGVAMYIKNNIIWERKIDLENLIESIWIEIFYRNTHNLLLCCLYRPPKNSQYLSETFNNDFHKLLKKVTKEVIIVGDCNANYANTRDSNEFKSLLSVSGFR